VWCAVCGSFFFAAGGQKKKIKKKKNNLHKIIKMLSKCLLLGGPEQPSLAPLPAKPHSRLRAQTHLRLHL
jgi:hypothetical protein